MLITSGEFANLKSQFVISSMRSQFVTSEGRIKLRFPPQKPDNRSQPFWRLE